jgi:hypothetical protein
MRVLGSAVLAFEAVVVLLATSLATSNGSVQDVRLAWILGLLLMALLLAAIGTLRRPWGVVVGWVLQVLVLATALVVGWSMVVIGGIFVVLWFVAVRTGRQVDALRAAAADDPRGGTVDT